MKLSLAKKITCMEQEIPEKWQSQKQRMQWRSYVISKLDDQRNIREILARHPLKKKVDGPGTE